MFIYVGQRYTAAYTGSTWRSETCEHCGELYHYIAEVMALGEAESPYGIDSAGARKRAERRAWDRLEDKLESSAVPIPCAYCARYQTSMFPPLQKPLYGRMRTAGILAIGLCWLVFIVVLFLASVILGSDRIGMTERLIAGSMTAASILGGITLLLLRKRCQRAYNPNERIPQEDREAVARQFALTAEQFLEVPTEISTNANGSEHRDNRIDR